MFNGMKNIEIRSFVGKVVDVQHSSETHVNGEGGGGYHVSIKVDSKVINHLQIFLADEQGREQHIRVSNWDFPVRAGQEVEAVSIRHKIFSNGYTVALLKNKNLNVATIGYQDLKVFCKDCYILYKAYAWFSIIGLFFIGGLILSYLDWASKWFENFAFLGGILSYILYMIVWRKLYFNLKSKLNQLAQ